MNQHHLMKYIDMIVPYIIRRKKLKHLKKLDMKLLVKLVKIAKSQNGDVNCKLEIHNDLYKYVKKCLKRDMENEISKIENKLYHFLIEDFSENFKFEYKGERYNY